MKEKNRKFEVGDIVELKADPTRKGPVIEILPEVHGQHRYKVFHGQNNIQEYLENQLVLCTKPSDMVYPKEPIKPEEFMARLNALRLSYPQVDSIYSLHAARIQFIPFQFKPLIRFLRSEEPRLLIADEVGVGKTIEAGLILRELQSRQELKNVLIVCPKALVTKWRAEMRRFDEDFHPLTAETLRYCLKETYLDGAWPSQYSKAIVHLEILRREDYLESQPELNRFGLLDIDPPPEFDLVIVDEAHHLRTPDTNTNKLARFLSNNAEAMLFLTATPIQLGSTNLYTLLNLLRPDRFIDEALFNEMVEPNKYINEAIRSVRTKMPEESWLPNALEALDKAKNTSWGYKILKDDALFMRWYSKIQSSSDLSDEERIEFIRDMEEVNTLSHVMNRTRRRDIGNFTIREPITIQVDFTPEQKKFYESILSFRKEMLLLEYDPIVIRLIMDTLERQAASCLPGLLPLLDTFIRTGKFSPDEVTDIAEEEAEQKLPKVISEKAKALKAMAKSLPETDPKLNELLKIVSDTIADKKGPGKVLVFSYFLHTLSYLQKKLKENGFRVAVVSGKVPDYEREIIRERFRKKKSEKDAIDVLLSSEVGCEGLDYEFCSRLVNYDLPWNPMRIEQRIGRIDRFGQVSEKIQIYNFITPGTVEERIFFRCFDRIGIFKQTIGDMEEILGELTEALTKTALDPSLTPSQAEEKARQLTDNALRKVEEQRRLEEQSTELLGLDELIQEEIGKIEAEGRFVTADDLYQLIDLYLKSRFKNARITVDKKSKIAKLYASKEDKDLFYKDLKKLRRQDRQTKDLSTWINGSSKSLTLTFDQAVALEDRSIPFITPVHPLTKMAIAFWNAAPKELSTHVEVENGDIPEGTYVFGYYLWETIALRGGIRLIPVLWHVEKNAVEWDISVNLNKLLRNARLSSKPVALSQENFEMALHRLDEAIQEKRFSELKKIKEVNDKIVEQRLLSLERHYQRRLARVEEELRSAVDERIRRMKESQRDRIKREWDSKKSSIEKRRNSDIVSKRVAIGIMEVKA